MAELIMAKSGYAREKTVSNITIRNIRQADILKCPFCIIWPDHYRLDGSCKCDDKQERAMMIREWGYTKRQFKNIPLRKETGQ